MIKKTMKYTDFNGNEREEDYFFGLTKAEITEMELSVNGGLEKLLNKMIKEQDNSKLVEMFKKLILQAYGEKSTDGKYFLKNEEIRNKFVSTQAYSDLFVELISDEQAAIKFVTGIMPEDIDISNLDKLPENN